VDDAADTLGLDGLCVCGPFDGVGSAFQARAVVSNQSMICTGLAGV
jgi:hypothetical protein